MLHSRPVLDLLHHTSYNQIDRQMYTETEITGKGIRLDQYERYGWMCEWTLEMDEMVPRAHDGVSEYDGTTDVTGFLGLGVELCGIMLDNLVLCDRSSAYLLPLVRGEL